MEEIGISLVQQPHRRDKYHCRVATSGQQYPVGIASELQCITDITGTLVTARQSIRPSRPLSDQVRTPRKKARVELETLASKFGHASSQLAARPTPRVTIAFREPWAVLDAFRLLEVIHHTEAGEIFVLRRCNQTKSGFRVADVAFPQIVFGFVEVPSNPEVISA